MQPCSQLQTSVPPFGNMGSGDGGGIEAIAVHHNPCDYSVFFSHVWCVMAEALKAAV